MSLSDDQQQKNLGLWRQSRVSFSNRSISLSSLNDSLHSLTSLTSKFGDDDFSQVSSSSYQNCGTVDEALSNLYSSSCDEKITINSTHSYDWLLDGVEPSSEDELEEERRRDRLQFEVKDPDEKAMNNMLNHLELEESTFTLEKNTKKSEEEEWGEFVGVVDDDAPVSSSITSPTNREQDCDNLMIVREKTQLRKFFNADGNVRNPDATEDTLEEEESFPIMSSYGDDQTTSLASSVRILNNLALPSANTALGRFTRRIMLEQQQFDESEDDDDESDDKSDAHEMETNWWNKSDKKIEMNLPREFYIEDFDPIPPILHAFPSDKNDVDDYLTQQLCEMDVSQRRIVHKLTQGVKNKYDLIIEGMKGAQEVDVEIAKAHMHISSSRAYLRNVKAASGIESSLNTLRLVNQKEDMQTLSQICDICWDLFEEEREVLHGEIKGNQFGDLIMRASELKRRVLGDAMVKDLNCLADLRNRVCKIMLNLKGRVEDFWLRGFLKESVLYGKEFNVLEYKQILKARHMLQSHLFIEVSTADLSSCSSDVCGVILSSLKLEASRSLANVLIPTISTNFNLEVLGEQIKNCPFNEKEMLDKLISTLYLYAEIDLQVFENVYMSLMYILALHNKIVVLHKSESLVSDSITGGEARKIPNKRSETGDTDREHNITYASVYDCGKELWDKCATMLTKILEDLSKNYETKDKWDTDLNSLEKTLNLVDGFLTLQSSIYGEEHVDKNVGAKTYELLNQYFRTVHVCAMNELGDMIRNESWVLNEVQSVNGTKKGIWNLLKQYSQYPIPNDGDNYNAGQSSKYFDDISPYLRMFNITLPPKRKSLCVPDDTDLPSKKDKHDKAYEISPPDLIYINTFWEKNKSFIPFTTHSSLQGICKWTSRILSITTKIPVLASYATHVLSNIYDLYFVTSLRLCMGSADIEKIVLDGYNIDENLVEAIVEDPANCKTPVKSTSRFFGSPVSLRHNLISPTKKKNPFIEHAFSPNLEGRICAPLRSEINDMNYLSNFIKRAHAALEDIGMLDKIDNWISDDESNKRTQIGEIATNAFEKRSAAALSCLFVAALLDSAYSSLDNQDEKNIYCNESSTFFLKKYRCCVLAMAPVLADRALQMAAIRVVQPKNIVTEIVKIGRGWDEATLHEQSNSYVDILCDRCAIVWFHICNSKQESPFPTFLLARLWEKVILAGFLSLLEGFSKITSCSTEGRALMSMDLATFTSEVSPKSLMNRSRSIFKSKFDDCDTLLLSPPPRVSPSRGMQYVDIYVKVFYFDEDDIMSWIKENFRAYHLSHCLAIIFSGVGGRSSFDQKVLFRIVNEIKDLYNNGDKLSNI